VIWAVRTEHIAHWLLSSDDMLLAVDIVIDWEKESYYGGTLALQDA
jgi:hypothetical protein